MNQALLECHSDYVWICDDDDIALPNALEILVSELDRNPSLGYVFGAHKVFLDTQQGRVYKDPEYWFRQDEPNFKICFLEGLFAFQFATLVRFSVYQDIGNFREDLLRSQDYEMAIRISRKYSAKFVSQTIFLQRHHDEIRGTALCRFSVEENEKRWMYFDRIFFLDTIQHYNIEEFTPSFALTWEDALRVRASYLQKACIFANRGMWDVACKSLELAGGACQESLSIEEKALFGKSISKIYLPWEVLLNDKNELLSLQKLSAKGSIYRQIVMACCHPLFWNIRHFLFRKDILSAVKLSFLLLKCVGLKGIIYKVFSRGLSFEKAEKEYK